MSILRKGVIRAGQVIVAEPISLPDGTEVTITGRVGEEFFGAEDNDRPSTPEEIAADLAAMAAFEPLSLTDAEVAAWEAERQAHKEWEKAHFFEHADKLQRLFDAEVPPR